MIRFLCSLAMIWAISGNTALAQSQVPASRADISLSFAPVVRAAAPAVVNIYAKRVTQARPTPFMNDPFFQRFFDGFGAPEPRVQSSLGSGVILSSDGIVVSNYHVVGMATEIRVVLTDRTEYEARVLLGDEDSDLAILQLIGAEGLPHLSLRDSDDVEVGELVLAIGNPFGVGQTVSSGIVSGLARSGGANGGGRGYFIQTDAPINPGNSGGALVDVAGQLIGINTSILSRSGGSNGIGFAIPTNLVAAFVDQAQTGAATFERPWAGLSGQPVDADMAASLNLARVGGIVVSGIHPASPFRDAGFAVGDVITSVDGLDVNTPSEMVYRMSVSGLGKTSDITRMRDGKAETVPVQLMQAPDTPSRQERTLEGRSPLAGLSLVRINPAVIAEMNLPIEAEGVVVTRAAAYAARAGFRPGDIIEVLNDTRIETPAQFEDVLNDAGRSLTLVLVRAGQRRSLRLRL